MTMRTSPFIITSILAVFGSMSSLCIAQKDSLEPLKDNQSPQTIDEVWGDYDPTVEPLETQVYKEWVEDGVVIRAVRYCIGTFKGKKSWMGGFYAFPEGGGNLPALVQIHGGGGAASKKACIENAKRGYATFSMNWREDDRYVTGENLPAEAQTDWGAVEGKQVAESRGIEPNNEKRYDSVPSARNSGYFLRTLAARRALTFLEQQPEVDGKNMGVDGHSMGGVITLQTAAIDSRVKASAPSCAPPLLLDGSLLARTAQPEGYVDKMDRAMLFMSPSNDFHGVVEAVEWINEKMPSKDFRIARSEHVNHKHSASAMAAKEIWFDSHLKGGVKFPAQPSLDVELDGEDGLPKVRVKVDESIAVERVDVFFTRDAKYSEYATNRTRFWHFADSAKVGDEYETSLDLFDLKEPLWVFANVHYVVPESMLTKPSKTFVVTTRLSMISSEQLKEAGLKADGKMTAVIETFEEGWEKEWIVSGNKWETWKLNDARVQIPNAGKLVLEMKSDEENQLSVDIGKYRGVFPIKGGSELQRIEIYPFDLMHKETKAKLLNFKDLVRPGVSFSTSRSQPAPVFEKLMFEEVPLAEFMSKRPFQLGEVDKVDGKTMLTFDAADKVVGRIDAKSNTVKISKEAKESEYKVGLQVHSYSEVSYFLNGEFTQFSTKLVSGYQASVTCEVHVDGKKVYDSGKFGGKSKPIDIDIDITGAQELRLVVTEGGNGWGGDWIMWANAGCE